MLPYMRQGANSIHAIAETYQSSQHFHWEEKSLLWRHHYSDTVAASELRQTPSFYRSDPRTH